MIPVVLLAATAWIACGLLGAAGYRSAIRIEGPETPQDARQAAGTAMLGAVTGLIFLIVVLALSGGFYDGLENPFSAAFWRPTPYRER
jgi:hypothetical protein